MKLSVLSWLAFTGLPTSQAEPEPPTTCSCAPLEYTFQLDLSQNCEDDTLDGSPGIGLTFCFLGIASATEEQRKTGNLRNPERETSMIAFETTFEEAAILSDLIDTIQIADITPEIEIVSIQFLEFDTTGELIVINQDDSYANVSLATGDSVTFKSISNALDPSVPIEEQLDYLPGGVQVTMRGQVTDENGEELIVSNRITWSYSNACDAEPIQVGDAIGWLDVSETEPASQAFCPVAPPAPTTAAPTSAPTAAPTSTMSTAPTSAPSTAPTPQGKSGKSAGKSGKAAAIGNAYFISGGSMSASMSASMSINPEEEGIVFGRRG